MHTLEEEGAHLFFFPRHYCVGSPSQARFISPLLYRASFLPAWPHMTIGSGMLCQDSQWRRKRRESSQLFIPLSQAHSDALRPVLDGTQSISSPCPIPLLPLPKCPGIWVQFPLKYRQIYCSPLSNQRLRRERIESLQLLWLPLSFFPSLPLHKLNPLHWLHICISGGKLQLFNDSTPWFPLWKTQGWLRWPRHDHPLSAMLERSIWLKITQQWRALLSGILISHSKCWDKIAPQRAYRTSWKIPLSWHVSKVPLMALTTILMTRMDSRWSDFFFLLFK